MTTRKIYDMELQALGEKLADMGRMIEYALDLLLEAIDTRDSKIAQQIVKDDRNVNDMERNIEAKCLSLITTQQPVAGDLRLVSSILKVVTDIERIGDQTSDIAEIVMRLRDSQLESYSGHIQPMITAAKEMVHEAVAAFIERNRKKSNEVIQSDDIVDDLFNKVKTDIVKQLKSENADVDACVDVLMIAKYLERIGDHAVNISEWEIFRETGSIQDTRIL